MPAVFTMFCNFKIIFNFFKPSVPGTNNPVISNLELPKPLKTPYTDTKKRRKQTAPCTEISDLSVYTCVCVCARVRVHARVRACVCVDTYVWMKIDTYIYTCTQTQTCLYVLPIYLYSCNMCVSTDILMCLIVMWQVIVLNESSESRTIKLVLPLTETCVAMEIISCFSDRTKHKQNSLLILSKSGRLDLYNDSQIEHYLSQCQSKSTPSLPNHFVVKLPFSESSITIAKLYTGYCESNIMDEVTTIEHKY